MHITDRHFWRYYYLLINCQNVPSRTSSTIEGFNTIGWMMHEWCYILATYCTLMVICQEHLPKCQIYSSFNSIGRTLGSEHRHLFLNIRFRYITWLINISQIYLPTSIIIQLFPYVVGYSKNSYSLSTSQWKGLQNCSFLDLGGAWINKLLNQIELCFTQICNPDVQVHMERVGDTFKIST